MRGGTELFGVPLKKVKRAWRTPGETSLGATAKARFPKISKKLDFVNYFFKYLVQLTGQVDVCTFLVLIFFAAVAQQLQVFNDKGNGLRQSLHQSGDFGAAHIVTNHNAQG